MIERAWRLGCRLDAWTELFHPELWRQAFAECELDPFWYSQRFIPGDETLPWEHVSAGVEKDWLWNDYQRSLRAETLADCAAGSCTMCGIMENVPDVICPQPQRFMARGIPLTVVKA